METQHKKIIFQGLYFILQSTHLYMSQHNVYKQGSFIYYTSQDAHLHQFIFRGFIYLYNNSHNQHLFPSQLNQSRTYYYTQHLYTDTIKNVFLNITATLPELYIYNYTPQHLKSQNSSLRIHHTSPNTANTIMIHFQGLYFIIQQSFFQRTYFKHYFTHASLSI